MKNKHEVRSLEDICNLVNSDNFEKLAEDLRMWLISYHLTIQKLRDTHPKETKGKLNTEIAKGGFIWIDDGKNDLKGVIIQSGDKKVSWLVSYFRKGEDQNIKYRRFFDRSEDYIDGYIDKLREVGGPELVVMKEEINDGDD